MRGMTLITCYYVVPSDGYIWRVCCILHVNICKYREIQIQAKTGGLYCSYKNHLLNSWLLFFGTKRETQFLKSLSQSYDANNTPNVRHISWCFRSQFIFASRDPKNLTAAATVENSTVCLHGPMLTFNVSTPWSDPTSIYHGRTPTSPHHGRTPT